MLPWDVGVECMTFWSLLDNLTYSTTAHADTDTHIVSVFFYYSNSLIVGVRSWVQSLLSHIFITPCIMSLSLFLSQALVLHEWISSFLFILSLLHHISCLSVFLSLALVLYEATSPFIFILDTVLRLTAHPPHDQLHYPTQHGKA